MKNPIPSLACAIALIATLAPAARSAEAPATVVSLADMKTQLTSLQNQLSGTVAALEAVKSSAKNEAALTKSAADFAARFKALEAQVETTRKNAVVAKARAKEHYASWQKDLTTVQNPAIREKAQSRYTASQAQFEKIIAKAERAKEEALPFVSELKDIAIYLEADLTKEAVDSLSNTIWKMGPRAKSVNSTIGDVIEQIDDTIKSLPKK